MNTTDRTNKLVDFLIVACGLTLALSSMTIAGAMVFILMKGIL